MPIVYDRDGRAVDLQLPEGDYATDYNMIYSARDGGHLTVDQYIYINSERLAILSRPGYGSAPRNLSDAHSQVDATNIQLSQHPLTVVLPGPDPVISILPQQSVPVAPRPGNPPAVDNAGAAWDALQLIDEILQACDAMIRAGAVTPEIQTAFALLEDCRKAGEMAYARNDAAAASAQAQEALRIGASIGITNLEDMPVVYDTPHADNLPVIPGFSNAPQVPFQPSNPTVLMQAMDIQGMTAAELHELLKQGMIPLRPDGSEFIVDDFQGGFLLDGAPLNVWTERVWYEGQRPLLTSYWESGRIVQPPAEVLLFPEIPMPEDVRDNYVGSQSGGIGLLTLLGLAVGFMKR